MSQIRANSRIGETVWIYRPWLDLVVGCGAWSAPLLLLSYFSSAGSTLTWSVAFYVLALFFNYPHYMATIYRAYHKEEEFRKYRIFTLHVTLVLVLTLILTHFWIRALPWIFTLYLTASPWHYSGQNYGLFMMFVRRAGIQPGAGERRALYGAFLVSYAILFLNFHTGPSVDPLFVSLNIPASLGSRAQLILGTVFVFCAGFGLLRLFSRASLRQLIPALTLFSTQFTWFLLPTLLSFVERVRLPQSRFSTGILAVMHSAQYLWITSYYAKREATAGAEGREWRPWVYFTILAIGGVALFIPGPWLSSVVFHFDFTRSFLLFTALINIHHFILDGAIWKLRDGRVSSLLVNSRAQITDGAIEAGNQVMAVFRWLAGPSRAARVLRIGTAVLLLAWGCIDQWHYYLAVQKENLAALRRAASLVPYDTPLEMRLANRALEEGLPHDSVIAWQYAIEADHADPGPREAYLRYLLQEKRFDTAYQLTRNWLRLAPKDATLLISYGTLAQQFGYQDEAQTSWHDALIADPSRAEADLLLALALDKQGKLEPAIVHYEAYLAKVAQNAGGNLPPASTLISVALKAADCDTRADHPEKASDFYEMARTLAVQTHEEKLESVADIAEAALDAKLGQTRRALPLYQRALQLDQALGDQHGSAVDWYMYALFLRDSGFPTHFAYACVLRSQALLSSGSNPQEAMAIDGLRKDLEKQLGPEAAQISRNPEPVRQQAIALRP